MLNLASPVAKNHAKHTHLRVKVGFEGRWFWYSGQVVLADFQVAPNPPGVGVLSAPPPWEVNGRELQSETQLLHMISPF